MTPGTIGWIQVETNDHEGAERFYGSLFDWTFAPDPNSDGYHLITPPGGDRPLGGVAESAAEPRAIFMVIVPDVAATLEQAERLGGKVVAPATTTRTGLVFGKLRDPSGNEFGVFTPAAG